jgi:hypothetical protein
VLVLAFLASCLLAPADAAAREREVVRDVLGLYDSRDEKRPELTRLHRLVEMPLNHLGYRLTLWDIAEQGLPDRATLTRHRAVVTWFTGRLTDWRSYLAWAREAAHAGTRFIVFESVGALGSSGELPAINDFLGVLGVAYADYYVSDTRETRIASANREMVGFEARLEDGALPGHHVIIETSGRAVVHLAVTDPAHRWVNAAASALVVTGPGGGFVAANHAVRYDKATSRTQWIIDPFAFLEAALGTERFPIPDTTTVAGRRIYFSHIDGDGWLNPSSVEIGQLKRAISAEVVLERLIQPYPDLPVTVGLIAGDVDAADGGDPRAGDVARRMFALPQVEVASHTHTHPYAWSFYEAYQRDREMAELEGFIARRPDYGDRSIARLVHAWRAGVGRTGETTAVDGRLARARPQQPFDLEREVKGALEAANRLAPPGKPARVYLWSGDTRPFEAAVRATREAGVRNLNGGDSRLDSIYPSVAYVPALSRSVGAERQIYAVNSNENTYTNGWTGPFDAFKTLAETLDNTERPRRLKGFNLYYHSYSASRPDSLAAVVDHLDRARREPLTPITASHYAGIAEGFFSARIVALGNGRWRIRDRGELATMRFDDGDEVEIDYVASRGIVGHSRHAGALYVALDPAVDQPVLAIQGAGSARASRAREPARPRLVESRWPISNVTVGACAIAARAQGFGLGDMTWAGLQPGAQLVSATRGRSVLWERVVAASPGGIASFRIEADAIDGIELRIACAGPAAEPIAARPPARRVSPTARQQPALRQALKRQSVQRQSDP